MAQAHSFFVARFFPQCETFHEAILAPSVTKKNTRVLWSEKKIWQLYVHVPFWLADARGLS